MLKKLAFAAAVAALSATAAQAAQNTGTLDIQATIAPSCTVGAGTSINFGGAIGSITGNIDPALVNIVLTCNAGTVYTVGLGTGNGVGATTTARSMTRVGGGVLPYALYSNVARTVNFDDIATSTIGGTAGSSAFTFGGNEFIPVYGRIASGTTTPVAGTYLDAVTITVQF